MRSTAGEIRDIGRAARADPQTPSLDGLGLWLMPAARRRPETRDHDESGAEDVGTGQRRAGLYRARVQRANGPLPRCTKTTAYGPLRPATRTRVTLDHDVDSCPGVGTRCQRQLRVVLEVAGRLLIEAGAEDRCGVQRHADERRAVPSTDARTALSRHHLMQIPGMFSPRGID
jgi:hypothetical protein